MVQATPTSFVSTRNACKLCSPLGACMVFRGIEGAMPLLHGSQGCSTYIRRYVISHFKEPMDVASSNFGESAAIFGGGANLRRAIDNVIRQYKPAIIGIATTCLSETIGDDVPMMIRECLKGAAADHPLLVHVSTPSYSGTHMDGFHAAVRAAAGSLAQGGDPNGQVNILPGFVSAADLRYLREILTDFALEGVLLPDYSETLDGPSWAEYKPMAGGGTPLAGIRAMGRAQVMLEFGRTLGPEQGAGPLLAQRFGVPHHRIGMPIGVRETDHFMELLCAAAGRPLPSKHSMERGRLVDSYVDGHKYVFGKRAIVYGEEDLVAGIVSLLAEIGIVPVLCATGGESGRLAAAIREASPDLPAQVQIREGVDFTEIAEDAEKLAPDILIGNSKGYSIARKLDVPLIRIGFPVHDRFGGHRIPHLGYRGAQDLFDRIVNALIDHKQAHSPVGYSYM